MNSLIGIKAIYPELDGDKKPSHKGLDGKRVKNTSEENNKQVKTIIKMSKEGLSVAKIKEKTNCSPSFINKTRNRAGLIVKKKITKKQALIDLIKRSDDFFYSVSSASLKLGVNTNVIYAIMDVVPQIKRGTRKGEKNGLWYDRFEPDIIGDNRRKLG